MLIGYDMVRPCSYCLVMMIAESTTMMMIAYIVIGLSEIITRWKD